MSIIDKVVAAITPPETAKARQEARARAHSASTPGDWLSMVLTHHQQIEEAFAQVKATTDADARVAAQKHLGVLLTGHAIAEEGVLYPALATIEEKAQATMAYAEQSTAKLEMALLEKMSPRSAQYLNKLESIRTAVAHHMYEEEGTWFLELKNKLSSADQDRLSERYQQEFDRYVGMGHTPEGIRHVA
jgi:hemerythrin superfamily protein